MYLHQMNDFELSDLLEHLLEDALNNAFGINSVEKPINKAIGLLTQEFYRREEFDLDYVQMWHEGHALFMEKQVLASVPKLYNISRCGDTTMLGFDVPYDTALFWLHYYRQSYEDGKPWPNDKGHYPSDWYFYITPA